MKITMVGDIHGEFKSLNKIIRREQSDIIIQLGDNSYYWGNDSNESVGLIEPLDSKVYMLPGNHENWNVFEEEIGRNGEVPVEVEPNIFHCPIGSSIEVESQNILFLGGAGSIDKKYRIPKLTWWEQEELNEKDLAYIKKLHKGKKINILCSHTCPKKFEMTKYLPRNIPFLESSRFILNEVLRIWKPEEWYFGHFHHYADSYVLHKDNTDTQWWALDMTNHPNDQSGLISNESYKTIEI